MNKFNEYLEKIENNFTVKDLIKYLNTIDQNLPIGYEGHFGEFFDLDKFDFRVKEVFERQRWDDKNEPKQFNALIITLRDIGPEPD